MTPLNPILPDCSQIRLLPSIVERLTARPDVLAIWLGGSFATGKADRYSDVDLRLAVESDSFAQWRNGDIRWIFDDPCPGLMIVAQTDENILFHVILSGGEIFDLYIQPFPPSFVESPILFLASRDAVTQSVIEDKKQADQSLAVVATSESIEGAIRGFWINTHKHRKVLDRDLDLMAHIGLNFERDLLRRLWYVQLTGFDEPSRKTIHTLTDQTRAISEGLDGHAFRVLGAPMRTREELIKAIETTRDEVAKVGKQLATKLGFEYPHELEEVVREGWREWGPAT